MSLAAPVCVQYMSVCVRMRVCQPRACRQTNSSPAQDRITKFGPEVQDHLVKGPIALGAIDNLDFQGQI